MTAAGYDDGVEDDGDGIVAKCFGHSENYFGIGEHTYLDERWV